MGEIERQLLVPAVSILLFSISNAQEVNYGLSVGIGRAYGVHNEDRYNSSTHAGYSYSAAAFMEFPTSSNIKLQSSLRYYEIDQNLDLNMRTFVGPAPVNYTATLSYLAIPLTVDYYFPFVSSVYCIVGAESAYLWSSSSIIERDDGSSIEEDGVDQFQTVNLSVVLEIAVEWHFDRVTFFMEPQYSRGLMGATENAFWGLAFKTRGMSLNAGLKW